MSDESEGLIKLKRKADMGENMCQIPIYWNTNRFQINLLKKILEKSREQG